MPFYEYECAACKFYTEVMQKISDAPLTRCPSCGKESLQRLISAPVFRLKGSGWYETDFKSDKEAKRNLVKEGEPASEPAKTEDDKPRVRASKALKKVATKSAKKSAGKSTRSSASKQAAKQSVMKPGSKPSAPVARQTAKHTTRKAAHKAAHKASKTVSKKPSRKATKKPAAKKK